MKPFIQRLIDIDREIEEAETGFNMYLGWMVDNTPIPQTVKLLTSYLNTINKLKYAVLDLASVDDMFSAKIIYRAFIEQYLRFTYLFVRSFRAGDDSVAIRYNDALEIIEDFACKRADALTLKYYHDKDITISELWDAMKIKRTDLAKYSLVEVEQMVQEFSLDGIMRYLEVTKEKEGPGEETNLIFEHAWTLCFIQGGAGLADALNLYKDKTEADTEFTRMCTSALDLCTAVKMCSCLLYADYNKDFNVMLQRLRNAALKIHP